jgi:hypothetical protein
MRWRRWLAAAVAPFAATLYIAALAWLIDAVSPHRPHERLVLFAHYAGRVLTIVAGSPALIALIVLLGLLLFREFLRPLLHRLESLTLGAIGAKFKTGGELIPGVPPVPRELATSEAPSAPRQLTEGQQPEGQQPKTGSQEGGEK